MKEVSFEKELSQLEQAVKQLESEQLSLDEALVLFEQGMKWSASCQKKLNEARKKVEMLLEVDREGNLVTRPFKPEEGL